MSNPYVHSFAWVIRRCFSFGWAKSWQTKIHSPLAEKSAVVFVSGCFRQTNNPSKNWFKSAYLLQRICLFAPPGARRRFVCPLSGFKSSNTPPAWNQSSSLTKCSSRKPFYMRRPFNRFCPLSYIFTMCWGRLAFSFPLKNSRSLIVVNWYVYWNWTKSFS